MLATHKHILFFTTDIKIHFPNLWTSEDKDMRSTLNNLKTTSTLFLFMPLCECFDVLCRKNDKNKNQLFYTTFFSKKIYQIFSKILKILVEKSIKQSHQRTKSQPKFVLFCLLLYFRNLYRPSKHDRTSLVIIIVVIVDVIIVANTASDATANQRWDQRATRVSIL